MTVRGQQLAEIMDQHARATRAVMDDYQSLLGQIEQQVATVKVQAASARLELARLLLPDISAETVARAGRLTGFSGFQKRDPQQAMAREQAALERQIARISADERYRRREYLVGPVGELTRKLQEARSLLQPWVEECASFENLEAWDDLIESGYDTPSFKLSWLEARYWKLWAAGDQVCKALNLKDFGDDVLPAFHKVDEQRQQWLRQVGLIDGKISEIHDLVADHDKAADRLARLPEIFLDECCTAVAAHLANADLSLVSLWIMEDSPDDRAMTMLLRRVVGMHAKIAYLDELAQQAVVSRLKDLSGRNSKFQRKREKMLRPKNAGRDFSDIAAEPEWQERLHRLRSERDKLAGLVVAIGAYEAYDRFDLNNPSDLWWLEMTGKRPPGSMRELRSWYDRNPNATATLDLEDDALSAAVASSAVPRDDGVDFMS